MQGRDDESGGSRYAVDQQLAVSPMLADDAVYRALAASERRFALYYLLEHAESTVNRLAEVLSGREATKTEGIATLDMHERHRTALRHSHLPLLAEAGLVDFDSESGVVAVASIDPDIRDIVRRSLVAEAQA